MHHQGDFDINPPTVFSFSSSKKYQAKGKYAIIPVLFFGVDIFKAL